ncbi:MAG: PEP-CTERM sorting domain-containing protein [Candidatus Zixiibacteriota bacterium]
MSRHFKNVILVAIALLIPATLSAFSFVESVQDYGIDAGGYNYVSTVNFECGTVFWGQTANWWHTLSSDYMPVPGAYQVNQAVLEIQGWQMLGFGGEIVQVGGTAYWTPIHGWSFYNTSSAIFDLSETADSYWNSPFLNVSFTPVFELGASLTRSTLRIDYDRVLTAGDGGTTIATPEPTSVLLMGLGLMGGKILTRRRKSS